MRGATYERDRYYYNLTELDAEIILERFHEARGGEFTAEVVVSTSRPPRPGLLSQSKLNLLSAQAQTTLARSLLAKQKDTEWSDILTEVCHDAIKHYRAGDPVVDLRCVPDREGSRFLYYPWVEYGGPTVLFADGGTGKSMFALAIGLSVASGRGLLGHAPAETRPVLYLDWEADKETHAERLRAICAGAGIFDTAALSETVFYRRQASSLAESVAALRRVIAEKGIGFVIVDSMALARGGEPESADSTIRLFAAARDLDVPWLGIDHVVKNNGDAGRPTKPFGSVFTPNSARITWGMERADEVDGDSMILALQNHKVNNGKRLPRQAYRVEFRENEAGLLLSVGYESMDFRDVPGMLPRLGQAAQIATILQRQNGTMLIEDIQKALEAEGSALSAAHLRVVLQRHRDQFVPVQDGKFTRWGLLSKRQM